MTPELVELLKQAPLFGAFVAVIIYMLSQNAKELAKRDEAQAKRDEAMQKFWSEQQAALRDVLGGIVHAIECLDKNQTAHDTFVRTELSVLKDRVTNQQAKPSKPMRSN